jgi:hypothetical protein
MVSDDELTQSGQTTLYKGKPFTGIRADYHKNGKMKHKGHLKTEEWMVILPIGMRMET